MNEELMEKARQLRAAGVPVEEIEKYLQSKMQPVDDTVEVEAGYPERLATTILKGAQVIPGMKAFQALAGSVGSKFTDNPVSYSDAKAGLEEQTDRMGTARGIAAEVVSSPVMAPLMALRGVKGLSAAKQGALWGGASQALDYNPDETLESRLIKTGAGAAGGAVLGAAGSGVVKFIKSPPGTAKKVAGQLMPRNFQRATRAWKTATTPAAEVAGEIAPKGLPNLDDMLLPEAPPSVPATIEEAVAAARPIGNVVRNQSPVKQRGASKGQLAWRQQQMAKAAPAPVSESAEPTLEDLLGLSTEARKQGVSLQKINEVGQQMRPKLVKSGEALADSVAARSIKGVADDYRGSHKAPGPHFGAPLHDLTGGGQMYPDDVYSANAARYYGHGDAPLDKRSVQIAQSFRAKPDAKVTIYRAVPDNAPDAAINEGDWVTINPEYAKMHGESTLLGKYRILKATVHADEVWTNADSIHEYGYWPRKK